MGNAPLWSGDVHYWVPQVNKHQIDLAINARCRTFLLGGVAPPPAASSHPVANHGICTTLAPSESTQVRTDTSSAIYHALNDVKNHLGTCWDGALPSPCVLVIRVPGRALLVFRTGVNEDNSGDDPTTGVEAHHDATRGITYFRRLDWWGRFTAWIQDAVCYLPKRLCQLLTGESIEKPAVYLMQSALPSLPTS